MGKLKRARQKFHLSRTRALDSTCTDKPENFQITTNNTFPLDSVPENIFSAIEISPEDLKQKLPESDARSVVSSRSSSVKKPLLKKEKIKLRHELFIKKLEVVNQLRKEAKQKRKKKPKEKAADVSGDLKSLLNLLPSLQTLPRQKQPISKVKKSCPKMKERQKQCCRTSLCSRRFLETHCTRLILQELSPVTSKTKFYKEPYEQYQDLVLFS